METAKTPQSTESTETVTCICTSPTWMTVPEVALVLGKSREYLYTGLREHRFPGVKFGRSWSVPRAFIRDFVADVFELGLSISFEDYAEAWQPKAAKNAA